jgi:hypothetical protein
MTEVFTEENKGREERPDPARGGVGAEYSEVYIGDCTDGNCDRVATVRIHDEWVVCTLHHEGHLLFEECNEIDLTLGLIMSWRSQADAHGLDAIQQVFDRATFDLSQRREAVKERREALDRIEQESIANHDMRVEMGERVAAIQYPSAFARVLAQLAHYEGDDWAQFAADMTHTAGQKWGAAEAEWLHATLLNGARLEPSAGFLDDLTSGLGLDVRQRTKLAMAYTFGKGA